jgi:PAS domain S-box-containing protein
LDKNQSKQKTKNFERELPQITVTSLSESTSNNQLLMQLTFQDNEKLYREIANSVKDAVIMVNDKARVTLWNSSAEEIFGYSNSEAIGKNIHELVVPFSMSADGRTRIKAGVKTFAEVGMGYFTVGNIELGGRRKDNTEFPAKLSLSPLRIGEKWFAIGIVKDITEKKIADQKLKDAEQRYHNLFNHASLGVLVINPETASFVEFNDVAHTQLGYSRAEFEKLTIHDVEANQSPDEVKSNIKKILAEGGIEFQTQHRTKTGELRDVMVTVRVFQSLGKTYLHSIFHDITEIRRTQDALVKSQSQLSKYSQQLEEIVKKRTKQLEQAQAKLVRSERLAAIGELAGMVGHDLRNPLSGIKNSAYLLKKKRMEISEDQSQELLGIIDNCVNYSNKIVNDLLDYSREIHLELQELPVEKLLTQTIAMLTIPKNIEIQLNVTSQSTIEVDPEKIERVFINLIKNAMDAMQNVGKISIDTREVDSLLEISFADTGMGISDDVLPKLFLPLVTTKAQGMGFGLAICKRLVEAHGGTIKVKTAIGKGTTFTVSMPIKQPNRVGVGGDI